MFGFHVFYFLNQSKSLLGETTGRADSIAAGQRGVLLHPERHAVLHVQLPQPAASNHRQDLRTVLGL